MSPDASSPPASTPAKRATVAETADSAVPDAGQTKSLLCVGTRAGVAASACNHASVATSNAPPSAVNSTQRIGWDQRCAVPSTSPRWALTSAIAPPASAAASRLPSGANASAVTAAASRTVTRSRSLAPSAAMTTAPVASPTATRAESGAKANAVTMPSTSNSAVTRPSATAATRTARAAALAT